MKRRLVFTSGFTRDARRLRRRQPAIAGTLAETLRLLQQDAFGPLLHTHKLRGRFADRYASTVAYDIRIIFRLERENSEQVIVLLAVGTHDEVY
jgi:addiction module RelE/StbE family toxin